VLHWITANWVGILAFLSTSWTALNLVFNRIANSLPAPTATSTPSYTWWFQFANNLALNTERGKNPPRVENSPNFEAAAEAYMQRKLNGGQKT
jgi:hypothetical protein